MEDEETSKMKKSNPKRMTPEQREDARDVALVRREQSKGGKTYSHAQVMREIGRHDLATPLHKRS